MATTKPKSTSAVARGRKKQPPWLWIGAAGVMAVLALAASLSSGGRGGNGSVEGVEQTRPVAVTGASLPEFVLEGGDPAVGTMIPDVIGQSFDGSPVEIRKDGRAKLVLLVAHWCPHCQKEIALLSDWLKSNPLPSGVDLYTVSTSVTPKRPNYPPSTWLQKEGWTAKTLADSEGEEAADAYGLTAFPYFVAVDASGKVVARTSGEIGTGRFAALAQQAVSSH